MVTNKLSNWQSVQTTRIKICGITNIADALASCQAGASAIGLVFTSRSQRCVEIELAQDIINALPPFVSSVALFCDDYEQHVRHVLSNVKVNLAQFHGSESEAFCQRFDLPYIKAIAMRENQQWTNELQHYGSAQALLLDGHVKGGIGGEGVSFDWSLLGQRIDKPLIVAGGLNSDNVLHPIKAINPWGVDVSSGVELSPGIKSHKKIVSFCQTVLNSGD